MIKASTLDYSDSTGTRGTGNSISIGNTASPCGLNVIPKIDNIRQSTTPDLVKSNKFDTSVYGQFTNNMVAPPIFTEVICGKLSDSSIRDLYMRCWMDIAADPINILSPQFVNLGLSNIDVLDKGASLWTPFTVLEGLRMLSIGSHRIIFLENYSGWRHCEHKVRL